jgi:hypothetical protein
MVTTPGVVKRRARTQRIRREGLRQPASEHAEPRRLGADSDMVGCKKGRNFLFTMPYAKSFLSIIGICR